MPSIRADRPNAVNDVHDGNGPNGVSGWPATERAKTNINQPSSFSMAETYADEHVSTVNGAENNDQLSMPIAICGMGVRLPGGIRTPSELYDLLSKKQDAKTVVPKSRFDVDAYYDESKTAGTLVTPYGYFLNDDLAQFDTSMFSLTNAEVASMDPAQRLLLEVTREAFESAGEADFRGKNIGTFVGDFTKDWEDLQDTDFLHTASHKVMGKSDFVLSNRISFEYDLKGPSFLTKTACSATAEALNSAVMAIRMGSCPSAIVAGANLILTPRASLEMSALGVLAADGDCKTFDASANGFGRGESVCALYVKPLQDALRDGNPVRAVIRACDTNADGGDGSRTFGTPNATTQEALIRQTYAQANLSMAETKVVELHGTGTSVGDPLETTAIAECFGGANNVYIGSVKPNLGHGEGGSAMASIIKSVLALESRTILPNIKFSKPNPKIPWNRNLIVPTEPKSWPAGVRERMSINSFGLGGSNVHIVLDSASSVGAANSRQPTQVSYGAASQRKHLLLLSGNSEASISKMAEKYSKYIEQHPENLEAMAYTLACRRERLKLGSYCIVNDLQMGEPAAPVPSKEMRRVAFVFTGQGAQWVGMAQEMIRENAEFAASIRRLDKTLQSLEHPPKWSLEGLLLSDKSKKTLFNSTDISQPVSTAIQIAYVDALTAFNITPAAVVGHSSGEVAAAYAVGALTSSEAIITAYYRGFACAHNQIAGGMAAVGMSREEVEPYLQPGVVLACDNSDASVTISGDLKPLEDTVANIKEALPEMFVRQLRVPMAYHSSHMSTVAGLYHSLIAQHLAPKTPRIPWYSTVYGGIVTEAKTAGPQYFIHNMERPAMFRTAASQMLKDMDSDTVHLEIGPHSALAGPLRQIYKENGCVAPYVAVAERGEDAASTFLQSIGKLHCLGIRPAMPKSEEAYTLPDLPAYPWHYAASHWSESRQMMEYRFPKHRKHEILGSRILESSDIEPSWRNLIGLRNVPWMADHVVGKDIVFPAAGYLAMAGAAVGQLTGFTSYTVQEVNIAAALLIPEQGTKEVITSLRKRDLTSTSQSKWWEFVVSSESNGTWIKHCWGLVTGGCAVACPPPNVRSYTRKVDAKRWYNTMSQAGLNYGPRFSGLESITASPADNAAAACVTDRPDDASAYALHPSTLDMIFHSQAVALTKGQYREFDAPWLPTFIDQCYISAAGNQKKLDICTSCSHSSGSVLARSYGVVDEKIAFVLNGLRGTKMAESALPDGPRYWSVQWHPAIEHAPVETLIRPAADVTADLAFMERFSLLCAVEVHFEAADVRAHAQPHFQHYLNGIVKRLSDITQCKQLIPDAAEVIAMSREARQKEIATCRAKSRETRFENGMELMWRVLDNIRDILEGRESFLDIALVGGTLQKFYDEGNACSDIDDFFTVLGLNKPQLRVLEIGAGTGGTTNAVLKALQTPQQERLYQEYVITDVSAGFVNQCRQRFSDCSNVKYAMLDITTDPLQQGFDAESFDLIVASNVLHATPNLVETLTRCRTLLKPDGHLFMQELCSNTRYVDMIMGLFDGWWVGMDDDRPDRANVNIEIWDQKLRQSGFSGVHAAIKDNVDPELFASANIIARPDSSVLDKRDRVTVLKPNAQLSPFGKELLESLSREAYEVDECVWGVDNIPEGQDVVSIMDCEAECGPLLADIDAETLETLIRTVADASGAMVLWLMPPTQVHCSNPHNAQILGLARCARAELGMDFVTLELDASEGNAGQAVVQLLTQQQLARAGVNDDPNALELESEFVWSNGQMLVSRMHTASVEDGLTETASSTAAKHLVIRQPGMMQTMHWTSEALPPLAAKDVQVRITHVGLNFKDVATAMGIIDPGSMRDDGFHGLGCEGSAIVTAVGKEIDNLSVGDRVVVMDPLNAVFATETQLSGAMCVRIPDKLSSEDAAGLTIPYLTVLWSLMEKAHFKRGQSLLIHSAAGGVGIAAIHVARWLGAEIYCTAGSPAKVDFLVNELGVSRDRIFYSRDDSFVEDVLCATQRKGVDVVLNSLAGELLHASWQCVAAGGYMLDLGKRDFLGRGRLDMFPFVANRAFFGIDLAEISLTTPEYVVPYLHKMMELLEAEIIHPLYPTTLFEADKTLDAFRYMQKGVHTGRIVVQMPSDSDTLLSSQIDRKAGFRDDGLYLLAGGLGGLGRSIISWMVSHGARNFIVVSPSAGSREEHREFAKELREQDCELTCFAGDIADPDFINRVVEAADRPITGVIQLAMVLCDSGLLNMDHASWTTATRPKTKGTWNLHELLPTDMDFFVMCSSAAGTLGAYGQSNYAAANAYLDAFVQYRHGLGLPAAVLDIAAVGDVGYVASNKDAAERLERNIARFTSEKEFLQCFDLLLERSAKRYATPPPASRTTVFNEAAQIVLFNESTRPLSDPQNTFPWRGDPRVSIIRNNQGAASAGASEGNESLRSFLLATASEPERLEEPETVEFLADEIAKRVYAFLMIEDVAVDRSQTLSSMGADSLVAIEIRNWWKQTFGVEISALELADTSNTMEALGRLAAQRLKDKHSA